jgi:hypothetical protein
MGYTPRMDIVGNVQLIRGNESGIEALVAGFERAGFTIAGNPDAYVRAHGNFGIEEARELRDRAATRSFGDAKRIFIVAASAMTSEAQNALLKTLEEPSDAIFFFLVPAPESLLPTLRSRAQHMELPASPQQGSVDAKEFLAAGPAARLELLKPLLEKGDDDKRDLGAIITFLSSVERMLDSRARDGGVSGLEAVYRARRYLSDKGSLVKPLLEQVALLVPVSK